MGSPHSRGNSASLGDYLLRQLVARGWQTDTLRIHPLQSRNSGLDELLGAVRSADLIILSFPVYVDSLPTNLIRALQWIAADRRAATSAREQRLVAVVNAGFPEACHTEYALAICRRFASESGIIWAGGLGMGGGGMIGGRPLEKVGGAMWFARAALDMAALALAAGQPVPDEAATLFAKPSIPGWLYALFVNLGWRRDAKKNGVAKQLKARPYEPHAAGR